MRRSGYFDSNLIEKTLRLKLKPIRTCNSLHECFVCQKDITLGEQYHDGGYGNRAHVRCVEQVEHDAK